MKINRKSVPDMVKNKNSWKQLLDRNSVKEPDKPTLCKRNHWNNGKAKDFLYSLIINEFYRFRHIYEPLFNVLLSRMAVLACTFMALLATTNLSSWKANKNNTICRTKGPDLRELTFFVFWRERNSGHVCNSVIAWLKLFFHWKTYLSELQKVALKGAGDFSESKESSNVWVSCIQLDWKKDTTGVDGSFNIFRC